MKKRLGKRKKESALEKDRKKEPKKGRKGKIEKEREHIKSKKCKKIK